MNIIYKIKLYFHLLIYRGIKEKPQYSQNGEDLFLNDFFITEILKTHIRTNFGKNHLFVKNVQTSFSEYYLLVN